MPRRGRRPRPPKTPTTVKPRVPIAATNQQTAADWARGPGPTATGQPTAAELAMQQSDSYGVYKGLEGLQRWLGVPSPQLSRYTQYEDIGLGIQPVSGEEARLRKLMQSGYEPTSDIVSRLAPTWAQERKDIALAKAKAWQYEGPTLGEVTSTDYFKYITQGPHMPKWSDYPKPGGGGGGYAPRFVYRRPSYAGGGRGSVSPRTGLINWRIGL